MPFPLIRMWISVTSNNVTICLKQPQLFHVHSMHCKNKQTNKKTIRVTLINNVTPLLRRCLAMHGLIGVCVYCMLAFKYSWDLNLTVKTRDCSWWEWHVELGFSTFGQFYSNIVTPLVIVGSVCAIFHLNIRLR